MGVFPCMDVVLHDRCGCVCIHDFGCVVCAVGVGVYLSTIWCIWYWTVWMYGCVWYWVDCVALGWVYGFGFWVAYVSLVSCMLYVICFNFCTSARLLLRTRVCFVARTCTLRIPEYVRLVLMCGAFDTALAGVWCFDVLGVWMRLVWYLPQMLNV